MKKTSFIFILTLVMSATHAQHHFILGAGGSRNTIKTDELNSFVNTFNEFHQGSGFVPLHEFSPNMEVLNFSGGYRRLSNNSISVACIYMYHRNRQNNSTTLIQGSGYDFHYRSSNHDFLFELGYNIGGILTINALGSMGIGNNTMQIWKVYANGDRSLGSENDLPGHYQSLTSRMDFGGSVGLKLWKVYIPLRVTYGMPVFSDGSIRFMDYNTMRFRSNEMPKDYKKWAEKPMEYDSKNNITGDQFIGMRIQLGVEFMLPVGNNR